MSTSLDKKKIFKIALSALVFLVLWLLPTSVMGLPDISVVEHRVIAIFGLALILWITEAIPSWTTSMLIVVLLLLTCSNSSLSCFINESFFVSGDTAPVRIENIGNLVSYKSIMAAFANPVIMLFIGGFVIAIVASKMGIDVQLAKVMLSLFGKKSEFVLLGILLITGIFSMFISNTATAAMMLTFMAPVLRQMPADGKGKIALAMAIPIGANVGGIATPIGTPPNAIALGYLRDNLGMDVSFMDWIAVMLPYTLVLLVIAWVLLLLLFPFKQKTIELKIEGETKGGSQLVISYITIFATIFLWIFGKPLGLDTNVVAMIPVAVFAITGILTKNDVKNIDWDVLWLVSGGFALGVALKDTNIANDVVAAVPFATWSPLLVIIGASVICWICANIISHTATANLLIPVMTAVAIGMGEALEPLGGAFTLLMCVTLASSLGMILPIST
ncbi:MAG: SLC13/DASS family transporter, partial [Muribaculaceae bacterium]|nr:SLC13/DASS family transporter [Muribaculaceae bacterium]